jgi:hypothetical protein
MHRKFVFFNKYIGHSKNSKGPVFPPAMGHWDIGTWPGGLAQPGRKKKPLRFETQKKWFSSQNTIWGTRCWCFIISYHIYHILSVFSYMKYLSFICLTRPQRTRSRAPPHWTWRKSRRSSHHHPICWRKSLPKVTHLVAISVISSLDNRDRLIMWEYWTLE